MSLRAFTFDDIFDGVGHVCYLLGDCEGLIVRAQQQNLMRSKTVIKKSFSSIQGS